MKPQTLVVIDRPAFKITIEEHDGGALYLVLFWDKGETHEDDSLTIECETSGEAYRHALNLLDLATRGTK